MVKPRGKNAKRQAVEKQRLRDEADAKRAKGPPLPPSLPRVALDLYVVFDAADDVPSGEQPMGDNPVDAASASPLGELPRVVQVCRMFSFALLSTYFALSLSLQTLALYLSLGVIDCVRAHWRERE